jgi:hypothetical protein
MSQTVIGSTLEAPRKSVAAVLRLDANADCKPVAVSAAEWKTALGGAVERALVLAKITKQEASYAMGYPDQSAISKWITGAEPTQWHKLMTIDVLRPWISVAIAEVSGAEVETTVTVRRRCL